MKKVFIVLVMCLFVKAKIFSQTIKSLSFLPLSSVMNSTSLVVDSQSSLLNPAGLYSLQRLNFEVYTLGLNISYLGVALPMGNILGNFGAGIYNYESDVTKAGYFVSMGRNVFDFLAIGISIKTMNENLTSLGGVFVEGGVIFHPNESIGLDLFKNEFLNDKIFISFAIQNVGGSLNSTSEPLALRVGLGYNLALVGLRFFVDKSFLSGNDVFFAGLDFSPPIKEFSFLKFALSYDIDNSELMIGAGLVLEDLKIQASYSFKSHLLFAGVSGYFGKDRVTLSAEYSRRGEEKYEKALDVEKKNMEEAFELYQSAYKDLITALNYDSENKKAALLKENIEEKTETYKNNFQELAKDNDKKGNHLYAMIYYRKLLLVDRNNSLAREKVKFYSTNEVFLKKLAAEKEVLQKYYNRKQYLKAKEKAEFLLEVVPDDQWVRFMNAEIQRICRNIGLNYYETANVYYKKGDYLKCREYLLKSLSYYPDNEKSKDLYTLATKNITRRKGLDKAREEYQAKNYITAFEIIEAYLERNPGDGEALALRENIIKELKKSADKTLEKGISYYNKGEYEKAIEELNKVLLVETNNSVAKDYKNRAISKLKALKKLEEFEEEE